MAGSSRRSGSSVRGHFLSFLFPNLIVIIGDYSDVFDGTMIVLAMYTLNFFHPGNYLRGEYHPSQTSSDGVVMMEDQHQPTYHQPEAKAV
jgi:hypothetical protein